MHLQIETLDPIEAPLSTDFWFGFLGGAFLVAMIHLVQKRLGKAR